MNIIMLFVFQNNCYDAHSTVKLIIKEKVEKKKYFTCTIKEDFSLHIIQINNSKVKYRVDTYINRSLSSITSHNMYNLALSDTGLYLVKDIARDLHRNLLKARDPAYLMIRNNVNTSESHTLTHEITYLNIVKCIIKEVNKNRYEHVFIYPFNTSYFPLLNAINNYSSSLFFWDNTFYSIQRTINSLQIFINITSKDFKDEFLISEFENWTGNGLGIFGNDDTINFLKSNIIPSLMKNFDYKRISYITYKLRMGFLIITKKPTTSFDFQYFSNIYSSFYKIDGAYLSSIRYCPQIGINELDFFVENFPKRHLIQLCLFYILLSKSKIHKILLRTVLLDMNNDVFELFLGLLRDFGILRESECTFLILNSNTLVQHILLDQYFVNYINVKMANFNNSFLFYDVNKGIRFLMIIYLTFLRKYNEIDMLLIFKYLENILQNNLEDIILFKSVFDTRILRAMKDVFNVVVDKE
ncbi:hypothetical protein NGRA_0123 [Nosema granulosis]|uniref:Uncharacterized protein n=1 Tax=Nosema granulosis TaxID=83296 RepID=A0A9P6H1G0_9MICR|nr:hypothetical protein NGRA_0123 [Nosema granulosis]